MEVINDYIAGVLDTDGSISCETAKRKHRTLGVEIVPTVRITQKLVSYTAGVLDGDGYIGCKVRVLVGKTKRNRHHIIVPRILVSNEEKNIFDYLEKYCRLFDVNYNIRQHKNKDKIFIFSIVAGKNVKNFLEPLMEAPYFSKKNQAKLVLQLIGRLNSGGRGGPHTYSNVDEAQDEFLVRMLIVDELRGHHSNSGPKRIYTFDRFLKEWNITNKRERKIRNTI